MEPLSYTLAFAAGLVSILSPCVLPLLPIILGTAVSHHRYGPLALTAGLTLSFLTIGLFVATIGFSIGLDSEAFRTFGAVILVLAGSLLAMPSLQTRFALAAAPIGSWAEERFGGQDRGGLAGQFGLGILLGAVWTPCVGPTLGAASVLAARGESLLQVSLTMLLFAVGTAIPLVLLGALSREALMRWRGRMMMTGQHGKAALGIILLMTGTLLLSGLDKPLQAAIVDRLPGWLNDFATGF